MILPICCWLVDNEDCVKSQLGIVKWGHRLNQHLDRWALKQASALILLVTPRSLLPWLHTTHSSQFNSTSRCLYLSGFASIACPSTLQLYLLNQDLGMLHCSPPPPPWLYVVDISQSHPWGTACSCQILLSNCGGLEAGTYKLDDQETEDLHMVLTKNNTNGHIVMGHGVLIL